VNHLTRFQQFVEELSKSGKWHDFLSDGSSGLSKTKLVAATGIPRSAFYQSEDLATEVARTPDFNTSDAPNPSLDQLNQQLGHENLKFL
jgi:hypothetical protein